jgi:hypothetical protein
MIEDYYYLLFNIDPINRLYNLLNKHHTHKFKLNMNMKNKNKNQRINNIFIMLKQLFKFLIFA